MFGTLRRKKNEISEEETTDTNKEPENITLTL